MPLALANAQLIGRSALLPSLTAAASKLQVTPRPNLTDFDEFGTPIKRYPDYATAYQDPIVAGTGTQMGAVIYDAKVLRDGSTGVFIYRPKFGPVPRGLYDFFWPTSLKSYVPYEWSGDFIEPISNIFGVWPSADVGAYPPNEIAWARGTGYAQWLPLCGWGRWANQASVIDGRIGTCEIKSDAADAVVTVVKEAGRVVGQALKVVAPVIGLIPGIGSGVAVALSAAGSLAMGTPLEDAVIEAASQLVPGGPIAVEAFNIAAGAGKAVLDGKPLDQVALAAVREGLPGGDAAKAAFDAGIAIAQGKTLQDAGFQALQTWAKGNDLGERVAAFTDSLAAASAAGQTVKEVLASQIVQDVKSLSDTYQSQLEPLVSQIVNNPDLLKQMPADLAVMVGVPEPIARAALAMVTVADDGTIGLDPDLQAAIGPPSWTLMQRVKLAPTASMKLIQQTLARTPLVPTTSKLQLKVDPNFQSRITSMPQFQNLASKLAPKTAAAQPQSQTVKSVSPMTQAPSSETDWSTWLLAASAVAIVGAGAYYLTRR